MVTRSASGTLRCIAAFRLWIGSADTVAGDAGARRCHTVAPVITTAATANDAANCA